LRHGTAFSIPLLAAIAAAACATPSPRAEAHDHLPMAPSSAAAPLDARTRRELARVRSATAAFQQLDSAVQAGYARKVAGCVEHPTLGAMGYHHENAALVDSTLELEHPEILVYMPTPSGEYKLRGVEYIVPYSAWPRTRRAPAILGHSLIPSAPLKLWYLHVWVWEDNPSGMFASWNPAMKCPA
jgi:hypothetical protein